jgi:ABC-type lipoprotein release transport system permease subunit
MTFGRLLWRNLLYHWRGNLAVLLGVALGTAVLTGALLVGDSLHGSLRDLSLGRLGWVEKALIPGRFFREQVGHMQATSRSPAIILNGSASTTSSGDQARRAGGVTILGVDADFWHQAEPGGSALWQSDSAEVALNRKLAELLGANVGDTITLNLPRMDDIPRESLLGKRKAKDVVQSLEVKVVQVLPDVVSMAGFSLKPTPEPPRNAFVPLRLLQSELNLPGQANVVLVAGAAPTLAKAPELTLDDWGLRLRTPKERALAFVKFLAPNSDDGRIKRARWRGRVPEALTKIAEANGGVLTRDQVVAFYEEHRPYISLESRQLLLPPVVVEAARRAAAELSAVDKLHPVVVQSTLVYLVDTLQVGDQSIPYAVVAGVDQTHLPDLKFAGESLGDRGLALAVPPNETNAPAVGTHVQLRYYAIDEGHRLEKHDATFELTQVVPLEAPADDPDLTPEFPGITDKLDIGEWRNPPFPYDRKRITSAEEDYWKRYRATPRAYISLAKAQRLWGSRFGKLTSMQFYGVDKKALEQALLKKLDPERGGFVFQPVRAQAEAASGGTVNFGEYFLYFSFFLIVSALLLVGLLIRLNLDRRASEVGLLLAVGWSHRRVRWLLLAEGALLAFFGGIVGLLGALGYARLMLDVLQAKWPSGDSLNFLRVHVDSHSLVHGYAGALVVSLFTVVWATRMLGKQTARALLAGETGASDFNVARGGSGWSLWILAVSLLGTAALLIIGVFVQGPEAKAGSFFGGGALLLIACLAGVWMWLRYTGRQSAAWPSLTSLGIRNAGRNAVRSLLTVGLLAAATFLIVAVESFHNEVGTGFLAPKGGSGGFALVAETDVPIFQGLNQAAVRKDLGLTDPALVSARFIPCRLRGGDDTSCLNLYRPLQPRVLGVPVAAFDGRFHFSDVMAEDTVGKLSPWLLLGLVVPDGAVPAVVDATTAEHILHKQLGETVEIQNDRGEKVALLLVGLLAESIFQSEIVVSEVNFRKLFPRQEGFSFFVVECEDRSAGAVERVQSAIETALADQGVRVQTVSARLQSYLAVENMYLATFQALGGLGLVLGAVGLAIILLRGVWERRRELALLRALGFGPLRLAWLVLAENVALLLLGLLAGTLSALVSVAPHLAGASAHVLWLRIGLLLLVVLASGLIAGSLAVFATLRAPLLTALRRE